MKIDLIEFARNLKLKSEIEFIESFYNNNFILKTDKLRFINAAFKYKDELNLSINRIDYSSMYVIKMK
jgi:hypothetical protein